MANTLISDDSWLLIISFLDPPSVGRLASTSNHFYGIIHPIDPTNIAMKRYWKQECNRICANIEQNFDSKDWFTFYIDLIETLKTTNLHKPKKHNLQPLYPDPHVDSVRQGHNRHLKSSIKGDQPNPKFLNWSFIE